MELRTKASVDNTVSEREKRNQEIAYRVATESIVLLKNNGTLPIKPQKTALYGIGAALNLKGGTGSGEVNERHSVSIREGLENAGFTVTTDKWLEEYKEEYARNQADNGAKLMAKLMSQNPDDLINIMADPNYLHFGRKLTEEEVREDTAECCIYVIARQAGECADRSMEHNDYEIAEEELHNIRLAAAHYRKMIIIINTGSSMNISELEQMEGVGAILFYCQQGMEGGRALADILTGKVTPSGCLTDTWAERYADIPFGEEYSYLKGDSLEEDYREGIYVGYRYFDSFEKKVRYAFGYGASYTQFEIECVSVSNQKSTVTVTAKVTNTGDRFAGKKVVQLYVSSPSEKLEREYQSLAAFAKTGLLAPGESQNICLTFDLGIVAGYEEERACYILEAGKYLLRLGESSRKTQVCAVINLPEAVITEKCSNVCTPAKKLDILKNPVWRAGSVPSGIPELEMNPEDFTGLEHMSQRTESDSGKWKIFSEQAKRMLESLGEEEKQRLVMGTGVMGMTPIVTVAGSGAYSADFPEKKIANMVFCDGPAGLRMQKTSVLLADGQLKPVEPMMEFMAYLPPEIKAQMLGNPEEGTPMYQYATAFPVGTALAQTWNMELLEQVGDAVGTEMEEYGVTFWLAPGMNIHRNPLCGRNYEYFSEDPVVSGKCAAAITRGVQAHEGCYVTLKHFAANNQETNRNRSSSNLSERTLREIYLKGFEIAVKEGQAKGVMTSYNMLNGKYTSTWKELVTTVLKEEWGFDGLVMTDWFATGKGLGGNGETIRAGVDMLMPGGEEYLGMLKEDLDSGTVTMQDIERACLKVLTMLASSQNQKEVFPE